MENEIILIKTRCDECVHESVCKFEGTLKFYATKCNQRMTEDEQDIILQTKIRCKHFSKNNSIEYSVKREVD